MPKECEYTGASLFPTVTSYEQALLRESEANLAMLELARTTPSLTDHERAIHTHDWTEQLCKSVNALCDSLSSIQAWRILLSEHLDNR